MPKVSVVIPTYNRANCVGDAIRSVLEQTYKDFEIIVVDDGSTDNTPEVLAGFGDKIRIVKQENRGVSAARNAGIRIARGQWIAILDSDDVWEPKKLEVQIRDLEEHPEVVAHIVDAIIEDSSIGAIRLFDLRGLTDEFTKCPLRRRPLLDELKAKFFPQGSIIRKTTLDKVKGFDENLYIHEDLNLLARIALEGPFYVNTFIGVKVLRRSGGAKPLSDIHHEKRLYSLKSTIKTYAMLLDDYRLNRSERRFVKRCLGGIWCDIADYHKNNHEWRLSVRAFVNSIREDPGVRSFIRALVRAAGLRKVIVETIFRKKRSHFRRSEIC
mgnify:CR=1 FL=1